MTRLRRLTCKNLMGLEDLSVDLGDVTEISGSNATGKTSVIEALKALIDGGKDATLLRSGATEGEAVLVIDEDDQTWTFRKDIVKGTLSAESSKVGKVGASKTQLERLVKVMAANPVEFIEDKKGRVDWVLRTIDVRVTAEELSEVTGMEIHDSGNALKVISQVDARIRSRREGVNRSIRDAKGTVKQLQAALPPAVEAPDVAGLRARHAAINDVRAKFRAACQKASSDAIHELNTEASRKIEQIRAELAAAIDQVRTEHSATVQKQTVETEAELAALAAAIATAEEQQKAAERAAGVRQSIKASELAIETLQTESDECTYALNGLQHIKAAKSANLPIKGLEIRENELYINGIPFDRINEAEQYKIALKICVFSGGNIIFIDGIERWDRANREAFYKAALGTDIQFLVTRVVDDGELKVETRNKGTAS